MDNFDHPHLEDNQVCFGCNTHFPDGLHGMYCEKCLKNKDNWTTEADDDDSPIYNDEDD